MKFVLAVIVCLMIGSLVTSWDASPRTSTVPDDQHEPKASQPRSWGAINWIRGMADGQQASQATGKPMMVFRPGSSDDKHIAAFGSSVLSHPLIVETAEKLFVPVVLDEKFGDADREVLARTKANSHKKIVVGFLNADASDLTSHHAGTSTLTLFARKMQIALRAAKRSVPNYLTFVGDIEEKTLTAEFAMHCYWEGESKLGGIEGVIATRSGWREGLEVVQVQYLPEVVDYQSLLTTAQSFDCASKVFAHTDPQLKIAKSMVGSKASKANGAMRDAKASDQKYYLLQTPYRHLPMTPRQATKINALIKSRRSPEHLLSPRQLSLMGQISRLQQAQPNALKGLVTPEREKELGAYAERLRSKVAVLSSSQ